MFLSPFLSCTDYADSHLKIQSQTLNISSNISHTEPNKKSGKIKFENVIYSYNNENIK